jgi:hypothetical protein
MMASGVHIQESLVHPIQTSIDGIQTSIDGTASNALHKALLLLARSIRSIKAFIPCSLSVDMMLHLDQEYLLHRWSLT